MTEAEWLTSEDRVALLNFLLYHPHAPRVRNVERKLRLYVCGCCRLIWDLFPYPDCRRAVAVVEARADGLLAAAEVARAHAAVSALPVPAGAGSEEVNTPFGRGPVPTGAAWWAYMASFYASNESSDNGRRYAAGETLGASSAALHGPAEVLRAAEDAGFGAAVARSVVTLFRDVIGNPFRRVAFQPAWRTETAVALARSMYESRDFTAMPILADALQDAGCDSDDILNHCRDAAGVHARGCWVADLVLGKG
jgi:hypothetical protein